MASEKPSTPPKIARTFTNNQMQQFVKTLLQTANQEKNIPTTNNTSSDIVNSEQKSTRSYSNIVMWNNCMMNRG